MNATSGSREERSQAVSGCGPGVSPWCRSAVKRGFDLCLSVLLLALLLPVIGLVAIGVKLTSRGPVLFRQRRPGKDGREFSILKFRTMIDRRVDNGPVLTRATDPRVTGFGGFIRKWKFDELPQLVNVLRGEMSFVGPRPQPTKLWQQPFIQKLARCVLSVQPGITSQATVNFRNEEELLAPLSADEVEEVYMKAVMPLKLNMEIEYLQNATFASDIRIILKTVLRIFRRTPADDSCVSRCLPAEIADRNTTQPLPREEYSPRVDAD